jgi:hypothetical protein
MTYWIVDGKQMTEAEYEEHQRQELEAKERIQREAAALVKKLGETYEALTSLMQQHPEMDREITDKTAVDEEIYEKLRQNLERADEAPRCRWVRQDGTMCGSPQMRKHIYCYAHKQMMEARALALRLPAPEDANAIHMSLMQVQKALIDDTISAKKAGLLLYSLQLALTNVSRTTFGQADDDELVTEVVDEEEALSRQQSAVSKNLFTAKDAEPPQQAKTGLAGGPGDAKEEKPEKGLPRMNADERGLGRGLPLIHTDEEAFSSQQSAIRQNLFTAKDAQPPQQAKTGLAGGPGDAKEEKDLPLIHTDDTDEEAFSSQHSAIRQNLFTAKDAEVSKENGRVGWDKPTPNWDALG